MEAQVAYSVLAALFKVLKTQKDSSLCANISRIIELREKDLESILNQKIDSPETLNHYAEIGRIVDQIPTGNNGATKSGNTLHECFSNILAFAKLDSPSFDKENIFAEFSDTSNNGELDIDFEDELFAKKLFDRSRIETSALIDPQVEKQSAENAWELWKSWMEKNSDLVIRSDTLGFRFPFFKLSAHNTWIDSGKIKFTKENLENLPIELQRFVNDNIEFNLHSIRFEYSFLRVDRSWFSTDLFKSDFWSLDNSWPYEQIQIAAGGKSFDGYCPTYIEALVAVKNVRWLPKRRFWHHIIHELETAFYFLGGPVEWITKAITPNKHSAKTPLDAEPIVNLIGWVAQHLPESPKKKKNE